MRLPRPLIERRLGSGNVQAVYWTILARWERAGVAAVSEIVGGCRSRYEVHSGMNKLWNTITLSFLQYTDVCSALIDQAPSASHSVTLVA